MSWPTRNPNQAHLPNRPGVPRWSWRYPLLLLLFPVMGLVQARLVLAQDNPLREGAFGGAAGSTAQDSAEAGYLEQILPSLQKLQAESPARVAQPAPDDRSVPRTAAGLWRTADQTAALPEQVAPAEQTETGLPNGRAMTPWKDLNGVGPGTDWPPAANTSPPSPTAGNSTAGVTGASDFAAANPGAVNPRAVNPGAVNSGAGTASGGALPKGGGRLGSASAGNRLAAFQGVESLQLNSTLVKVGLNTLLVLAATIGLIVVFRKTLPRQSTSPQRPVGRLQIEQTLSLGGKAELKVVRCGLNQVLVAIDGGGIRSVVALEPALETEQEHLAPASAGQPSVPPKEPVNIEQFVKMIKDMEGDFMAARTGR